MKEFRLKQKSPVYGGKNVKGREFKFFNISKFEMHIFENLKLQKISTNGHVNKTPQQENFLQFFEDLPERVKNLTSKNNFFVLFKSIFNTIPDKLTRKKLGKK